VNQAKRTGRNEFVLQNQEILLEAIEKDRISGPIVSPQIF